MSTETTEETTQTVKKIPNAHFILTLKHIRKNPKLFNMDFWGEKQECGTVACLAGHASLLAGDIPLWEIPVGRDGRPSFEYVKPKESKYHWDKPQEVVERARVLLEIEDEDLDADIFYEDWQSFHEMITALEEGYNYDFSSVNWDEE